MELAGVDFGLHIETARLEEFLAKLCRFQEQIHKDQEQLASTLETVMHRLEKTEQWAEEQQHTLQQLRESVLSLTERQDALDAFKIGEKIERLNSHHSEVKEMQAQVAGFDAKVKSQEAALSHLEGRAVNIENKQSTLDEKFEKLLPDFRSLRNEQVAVTSQCNVMEARCNEVQIRQDELAASVENKYDNLWKGIEKSLENISTVELRKYHEDVQALSGKIEKNMNMRISYCLDILAKATETNRQKDLKKAVILRWREQAWLTSRRKYGFALLTNKVHDSMRSCFRRWFHQARWASELERVKEECVKLIPDLPALLDLAVNPRLRSLEQGASAEASRTDTLMERNNELWDHLQSVTARASALERKSEEDSEALAKMADELNVHADFRRAAEARVQSAENTVAHLSEQLTLVAREDDVKNMMKDILLIWTAVKHLDAGKADRKELENLGVEMNSRNEILSASLQKLEVCRTGQDSALEQRLSSLQTSVKDNNGKQEELEFMLGLVVKLLEDVANVQCTKIQGRRPVGLRLGSGRVDARHTRAPFIRPSEATGIPSLEFSGAAHAKVLGMEGRAGEIKMGQTLRCPPTSASRVSQPSSQPAPTPTPAPKQGAVISPSVAAFAEWVDTVRKTVKMDHNQSECAT